MSGKYNLDRFDFDGNIERAGRYRDYRSSLWPPAQSYDLSCLDLACEMPELGTEFDSALGYLAAVVETEWARVKQIGIPERRRFNDPDAAAAAMAAVAELLPDEQSRRAAELRTQAVGTGYTDEILAELAKLDEPTTVVCGQVSTWFGKETRGLPTVFGCRTDPELQPLVTRTVEFDSEVRAYLRSLHADLLVGDMPAFAATRLFLMAGEGNRHPKHIAYFLPEDEGVKYSPFKKSYYFANTHRAMLDQISAPLADRHLDIGTRFDPGADRFTAVPTLGVLAHELGHFVHRPRKDFSRLNEMDRWTSVVLQETAADVFGTLVLAEVWAPNFGIAAEDVIVYYLSECLRYTSRGFGHFPDSDGMFLQLSYLAHFCALSLHEGITPRLTGEPSAVLAGLRSLARVLADTLLNNDADASRELYLYFGPASRGKLDLLVEVFRESSMQSIEYIQEIPRAISATFHRG